MFEFILELIIISLPFTVALFLGGIGLIFWGVTLYPTDEQLAMILFIGGVIFLILSVISGAISIKKWIER